MKISDTVVTATHSIPYHIRHSAVNDWNLPYITYHQWFDRYYLLHWEGIYLIDRVKEGTIEHDSILYRINWIDVPSVCYKAKEVALSFRRIEGKQEGYVLIKVVKSQGD